MKYIYVIPGVKTTEDFWNLYTHEFTVVKFSGKSAYCCYAGVGANHRQCIFLQEEVIITDDP